MTASEFKQRLANGDRLAVVMNTLWEIGKLYDDDRARLELQTPGIREIYSDHAALILAALARAEARKK